MWLQVVEVTRVHPALGHVFGMYGRRNTAFASEQQRPHLFEQQLPICALVVEDLLLNSKPAARPPATRARLKCAIRLKVKISSNKSLRKIDASQPAKISLPVHTPKSKIASTH